MFFRFPASYRSAIKQFQAGQFSDALQSLNQTIQEKPDFWEAYQLRALANSALGYFTNAERDAQKAIQLNPDTAVNYTALGNVYWQQADFDQARRAYLDAYNLAPNVPLNQYNLGITDFKLGHYEDARDILRQTSKSKKLQQKILPEHCLYLYYFLAKSEEATGNDDNAKSSYKQMEKYRKSLDTLKEQLANCPKKLRESMEKDVIDIEQILSS